MSERPKNFERSWRILEYLRRNSDPEHYVTRAELLNDPVISKIAEHHDKSSAQVILRWNLQKGVVVIPGSSNPEHIKENTELFDFELTDDEMMQIHDLDRSEKHDWY